MIGEELGTVMQPLPNGFSFLLIESFSNFDVSGTATLILTIFTPMVETSFIFNAAVAEVAASLDMLCPAHQQARRKLILSWLKRIAKLEYSKKSLDTCSSANFNLLCVLLTNTTQPEPLDRYVVCHPLWDRDSDGQCSFGLAGHPLPRAKKT